MGHDAVVIVGMPTDERLREQLALVRAESGHGYMKPMIYTGSVKMPCAACDLELYVGPRQQEAIRTIPTTRLLCPSCVVKEYPNAKASFRHLGNPEGPTRG